MDEAISEGKKSKKKIEDWEVEDAVRTLTRAEELKLNPEMMKLVLPKLEKTKQAVENISQAQILYGNKNKDDKAEKK